MVCSPSPQHPFITLSLTNNARILLLLVVTVVCVTEQMRQSWSGVAAIVAVVFTASVVAACSDDDGPAVCPGRGDFQGLGIFIESNSGVYEVSHLPHYCVYLGCVTTLTTQVGESSSLGRRRARPQPPPCAAPWLCLRDKT